ncbi:hypothetical protein KUTeg_019112 [Tegillarca granosa]|uniref:Tetratricopeptide repeat protein 5 n=1 Tax=Tegillarca granosa TaxID=220873 RepID=A0ABQ9EE66_TEGGR|nr:hypothetical protein KUTeg_019112 [Tegillarca granosa]
MTTSEKAEEVVNNLYKYRDHYVENFGIEKAIQKVEDSKNKVSLRNLSMVLRQIQVGSGEERRKIIKESVDKAKEAVQLDIQDGLSWLILGNAYLSLFFMDGQTPQYFKLCMSAYTQAEKDTVAKSNPDLYFNRSIAHKYQEDYQLALDGFIMAGQLDPTWQNPAMAEKQLVNFLTNVTELSESKEFHYKSVRVHTPLVLVVNGKKLGLDKQAPSELAVRAVYD